MAAESIGGDGLVQAHVALAALVEDPEQFDQARDRRFSEPPPSYRTRPGTPTQPARPVLENDPLTEYIKRKDQLRLNWMASSAPDQFMTQHREEIVRIEQKNECAGVGRGPGHLADDRVKERWVKQGIWDFKWYESNLERWGDEVLDTPLLDAVWLHEAPPEADNSDNEEEEEGLPLSVIFGPKKPPKTEEEVRQSAERRAERRRRREVTRPIHQFNYQVSQERERLVEEVRARQAPDDSFARCCPPDISTQAYNIVKDRWISRRIWVDKWGVLPGMTWLHERKFDELALEELGPRPPPRAAPARQRVFHFDSSRGFP
ncbi:hypothetical protein DHEL01_v212691 [Diaporthe helianthi]|uniref:Uncharacterized protein n=1 Tax=Diaporthe helianthi TaxID=158607 RepID=A0A2P5HF92_DIAHE|nr:hypothetical protein DHEL01_v212691 [Diaporthe helianthi]